ncbi:MAG: ABC transporter substrate binding protein [Thermoguttaceae bacterium]|jgi:ABC-type uncharacterized transport system substrate-binding protein
MGGGGPTANRSGSLVSKEQESPPLEAAGVAAAAARHENLDWPERWRHPRLPVAGSRTRRVAAALSLCSRRLDAVVQIVDNLSAAGFPTIARAAAQARLPVFSFRSAGVEQGAVLAVARDYYGAGQETALKAVRVMRGELPEGIPLSPPTRLQKLVNLKNAQQCRLSIPAALLREAQRRSQP